MPSFDIVSQVDMHELSNAIDQANRELVNRFDFKGTNAKFEFNENQLSLVAPSDFQLQQMGDILTTKLAKRGVDIKALDYQQPQVSVHEARQSVNIRQGIDTDNAKNIVKLIKNTKLKVQASIQGDQVRVNGKKRDDLQSVITILREQKIELPLQYINFRD